MPPQPKIQKNETKQAIELVEQILGTLFLVGGFLDFPIGTIMSSVFLGLQIADNSLKNSMIAANPLGLSFSNHFVMNGNSIWFRDTVSGNKGLVAVGKLTKKELYSKNFVATNGYIPFTTKEGDKYKTYIRFLRNGTLGKTLQIDGTRNTVSDTEDKFATSSGSMFITYRVNDDKKLSDSRGNWALYRVIADHADGKITDYVVDQVEVKTGETSVKTGYYFDPSTAAFNASGLYSKAVVYPGAIKNSAGKYTDAYGRTESYFFNGKEKDIQIQLCNESGDSCNGVLSRKLKSLLTGKRFQSYVYKKGASIPSSASYVHYRINASDEETYRVFVDRVQTSKDGEAIGDGSKGSSKKIGVTKTIDYKYNKKHQLSSKTTTNQIFDPVLKTTTDEISTVNYVYAWKKYPAMADKNMLAQRYMSYASQQIGKTGKVVRSASLTTYKDWSGKGLWLPESSYMAKKANPSTATKSTDLADYIKTSEVLERDVTYGLPLKAQDMDGVVSQTWYSEERNLLPIASFKNANATRHGTGDAGYFGAEEYEHSLYLNSTAKVDSLVPYTGNKSIRGKVKNWYVGPTTFSADVQRRYIVSAWVRPKKGTSCSVGFGSAMKSSNTSEVWQYLEYASNINNTGKPKVSCESPGSGVDDFRYGPVDSTFAATVFNKDRSLVTANVGVNGVTVHHAYDAFGEPYLSYRDVGAGETAQQFGGVTLTGLSEFGGFDKDIAESTTTYSSQATISIRSKEDLLYDKDNDIGSSKLQGVAVGPRFVFQALVTPANSTNLPTIYIGPKSNPLLALEYDQAGSEFILEQGIMRYSKFSAHSLFKKESEDKNLTPLKLTLVVMDQAAFVFVNSKLVIAAQGITPIPTTGSSIHSTNYAMSHITFGKDPSLVMSYHDKAGRVKQVQTLHTRSDGQFETVVQETLYDGWGNAAVTTKPAAVASLFGYQEDFVKSFNWATGEISGDIVDYYKSGAGKAIPQGPNDYKYPYNRQAYENSPLDRPKQSTNKPGDDFKIDGKLTNTQEYRSDDDMRFMTAIGISDKKADKFSSNTSKTPFSTTKQVVAQHVSDLAGRSIAARVGTESDGYIQTAAKYEYNLDENGNYIAGEVTNYQPNAFDAKGVLNAASTYKTFGKVIDVLGRHTIGSVPDVQGDAHIFKDNAGRIRFTRVKPDWDEKTSQGFSYYKYDKLGRVIEKGVLKNVSGNAQFYLDKANDASYPPAINACPNLVNIYDYAKDSTAASDKDVMPTSRYQGRLYATLTMNNDIPDKPTSSCSKANSPLDDTVVENYYKYDTRGHISVRGTQRYRSFPYKARYLKLVPRSFYDKTTLNLDATSSLIPLDAVGKRILDESSEWRISYYNPSPYLIIDMTVSKQIGGFQYQPEHAGDFKDYDFYISEDKKKWTLLKQGTFDKKSDVNTVILGRELLDQRKSGYEYDNLGGLTKLIYPTKSKHTTPSIKSMFDLSGQVAVNYSYDILGRLKKIDSTNKGTNTTYASNYKYTIDGGIASYEANDQKLTYGYTYDFQGRLVNVDVNKAKEVVFAEKLDYSNYQYGNPRTISYSGTGLKNEQHKYEYEYDIWGRLKQAVRKTTGGKATDEFSYAYDKNGNILSEASKHWKGTSTPSTSNQQYNYVAGTNKLEKITTTSSDKGASKVRNFTHNAVGGITTMDGSTGKSITFGRQEKTERIMSMTQDGKTKVYEHDALGRRVSARVGTTETKNYYYGAGIQPLVEEVNGEQRLNIVGSHGLLAVVDAHETYYAATDHLSSTRVVLKKDGTVAGGFDYDPYGKTSVIAGKDSNALEKFDVRYTGQKYDTETQLYTFPARFMDPSVKRFLSIDPMPTEPSPYIYVGNNPITRTDPTGKSWWSTFKNHFLAESRAGMALRTTISGLSSGFFGVAASLTTWGGSIFEIGSKHGKIAYDAVLKMAKPISPVMRNASPVESISGDFGLSIVKSTVASALGAQKEKFFRKGSYGMAKLVESIKCTTMIGLTAFFAIGLPAIRGYSIGMPEFVSGLIVPVPVEMLISVMSFFRAKWSGTYTRKVIIDGLVKSFILIGGAVVQGFVLLQLNPDFPVYAFSIPQSGAIVMRESLGAWMNISVRRHNKKKNDDFAIQVMDTEIIAETTGDIELEGQSGDQRAPDNVAETSFTNVDETSSVNRRTTRVDIHPEPSSDSNHIVDGEDIFYDAVTYL